VHTFFYTGGNGSMDTALRMAHCARGAHYDLQVIGIPKTIDNDLCVTDRTPGYASTARFFACAARDVGEDNRSLPAPVCVLETLGRNAGWIVAATSLARHAEDDAPHLIYFPERRLSLDRIAADVERVYRRLGRVVVAVCEGQLDDGGRPFGADVDRADSDVQRLASNLGHTLARLLSEKLGIRARAEKPGLLGRCCGEFVAPRDRQEAFACGRAAAVAAGAGESGVMVALRRDSSTFLTPLETVASVERRLPADWIHPDGNDVLPAFGSMPRRWWGRFRAGRGCTSSKERVQGDPRGPGGPPHLVTRRLRGFFETIRRRCRSRPDRQSGRRPDWDPAPAPN
jgi:6-phosphofructokinase